MPEEKQTTSAYGYIREEINAKICIFIPNWGFC